MPRTLPTLTQLFHVLHLQVYHGDLPGAAGAVTLVDELKKVCHIEFVFGQHARTDGSSTTTFARLSGSLFLEVQIIR